MDSRTLEFHVCRFAKSIHSELGRAVDGMKRKRNVTGNARDIDDRSRTLLLHHGQCGLHAGDRPEEISVEGFPAGVHVHVSDRVHESVAGVVDPDIDALKVMQGKTDDAVNLFAVADVARERQGVLDVADALARGFGASRIPREQHNLGAFVGKKLRDRFSDTHGSARDHHNFSRDTDLTVVHLQVFAFLCDLCG